MNQDEAKGIFLQALPELSEPLKSAVEFALANWHRLNREPRPSDVAINFFASLPALPTNTIDLKLAAKLNAMAKLLRDAPNVWLSLENLPHEDMFSLPRHSCRTLKIFPSSTTETMTSTIPACGISRG